MMRGFRKNNISTDAEIDRRIQFTNGNPGGASTLPSSLTVVRSSAIGIVRPGSNRHHDIVREINIDPFIIPEDISNTRGSCRLYPTERSESQSNGFSRITCDNTTDFRS